MKPLFFLIFTISSFDSVGQNGTPKNNEERIIDLNQNGLKLESGKVIAWFPKDSLSEYKMKGLVDTLNIVIAQAEKFMGAPRSWQVFTTKQITFYFSNGNFVSNTSVEGFIFMPFWRIKSNKAPSHHEIMHVLLRSKTGNWNSAPREETGARMPLWLTEGLPEYMAIKIAYSNHFPKFDLHNGGGYLRIDSTCSSILSTEIGAFIFPYIGRRGVLLELFGEKRAIYAPPFYNCSCSFTKYLAEKYGLETVLSAIAAFREEHETIENLTGKTIESIKQEWLKVLKVDK